MRRETLTKLERLKLAAARERLKLDAAKARMIEEDASDKDVTLNQFGRPIVAYEDMPELNEADQFMLNVEFERLACPHWAVAKYRPGFGPKNELRKLSRDSWYFYETGQQILGALLRVLAEDTFPDLLKALSTDTLDMDKEFMGLVAYLELESEAKKEAVILHRTTVEKLDAKNKIELAKIRKDLDARYAACHRRNHEQDNTPV